MPATRRLEPTEALQPVVLRYEKHQDTIAVNSIEGNDYNYGVQLRGVEHYLHTLHRLGLDNKPSLDHIDYRNLDNLQDFPLSHYAFPDEPSPLTEVGAPSPPSPQSYNQPIYTGTTHISAVFLSILRIAQQNLPHLNLVSALNHVPNIRPTDLAPPLFPSAPGNLAPQLFLDASALPKRPGDEDITIAFLPYFYNGGSQHAIGYYNVITCPTRGRVLGTAFFTPCSEVDLRRYGLVEYIEGWKDLGRDGRDEDGIAEIRCAGCWEGVWLERDTVEEYDEWKVVVRAASVCWEGRMGLTVRGEVEG
ncbi:hypothetical protein BU25DRAFT_456090 [Macroventuria anomochaeta]|uniref:Uncharacterized protein n=1 Tax=Macroventuria anomochaeta TaxID=301207 RepID=A0ACB6S819_9PLEO|nr:uncharacterized protein BU25DRAFT_456090 [Macroventuria anomochaeta]KAF2630346.1 hypothetical protein BU25DRAFT_456090 [Macroventuria anomochaeta]